MRILAVIGALGIVFAAAAAAFFFGGFFNVAANEEDPGPVNWALIRVREASIVRHAGVAPPGNLADPEKIRAGAREFAEHGCVNCHGAPGADWAKFSEGLNPAPPDLKDVAGHDPARLFWVIRNGIKMTAMPSFAKAGMADDDIWPLVAFIKKLPDVSEADYKAWTAPPQPLPAGPAAAPPAANQ